MTEEAEVKDAQVQPEGAPKDVPENSSTSQGGAPEKPKKDGLQKRINELTAKTYQAEERAAKAEAEKQQLQQAFQQAQDQGVNPPHPDDYDSDLDYKKALDSYIVDKASTVSEKKAAESAQQYEQQRVISEQQQKFIQQYNDRRDNFEDFEQVVGAIPPGLLDNDTYQVILSSEKGPELIYHLGSNLNEMVRIAQLPAVMRAAELARIESRLEIPKPKTQTDAPDPIRDIQGDDGVTTDLNDVKDVNEWMKRRRAQVKNRG